MKLYHGTYNGDITLENLEMCRTPIRHLIKGYTSSSVRGYGFYTSSIIWGDLYVSDIQEDINRSNNNLYNGAEWYAFTKNKIFDQTRTGFIYEIEISETSNCISILDAQHTYKVFIEEISGDNYKLLLENSIDVIYNKRGEYVILNKDIITSIKVKYKVDGFLYQIHDKSTYNKKIYYLPSNNVDNYLLSEYDIKYDDKIKDGIIVCVDKDNNEEEYDFIEYKNSVRVVKGSKYPHWVENNL